MRRNTPWTPWLPVNVTQGGARQEQRFRFTCRAPLPDPHGLQFGKRRTETRTCPADGTGACDTDGKAWSSGGWGWGQGWGREPGRPGGEAGSPEAGSPARRPLQPWWRISCAAATRPRTLSAGAGPPGARGHPAPGTASWASGSAREPVPTRSPATEACPAWEMPWSTKTATSRLAPVRM